MGVRVVVDRIAEIEKAITDLSNKRVMVGIPQDSDKNTRNDASPLTNAQIGYIMETGAPERNIPARPFLVPGVASVQEEAVTRLKAVGKYAMEGKPSAAEKAMMALGLVGQNAVRQKITDGPFVPLSPATVAARRSRHKSRMAATAADVTPLIDTGQLRNSITFAIRKIKGE